MKSRVLLLAIVFVSTLILGCGSGDEDLYDPQAQLAIDISLIENYLSENNIEAEQDELTGMYYVITTETNGESGDIGNIASTDYELYNFSGTLLDTSKESVARSGGIFVQSRNYQPFEVLLGGGRAIPGFERALYLLKTGERGTFYVPSALAYQNRSVGNIGPNENLIFDIELLSIE